MEKISNKWNPMLGIVTRQQALLTYAQLIKPFNKIVAKRVLSLNLIAFMLQFAGLTISTLNTSTYPFWFASGTACGFIFMWGRNILPGILLGSFFAYFFARSGLAVAAVAAVIFTLQAWLLLWLSYRYVTLTLIFYQCLIYFKFILLAAVLTAISTFLLVISSSASLQEAKPLWQQWLQWWLANLDGLFILSFAFIALDSYFSQLAAFKKLNHTVFFSHYGILIVLIMSLLFSTDMILASCFAVFILTTHFIISYRYRWCGMVASAFIMGLLFCFAALLYTPFFKAQFGMLGFIFLEIILFLSLLIGGLPALRPKRA